MASEVRELISIPEIEKHRKAGAIGGSIELHDVIDSTNIRAKALARQGAAHGMAVLAESQTAGHGRFGRTFYSPQESGIYISFILRPEIPADRAVRITAMAAVAAARAIERLADVRAEIKWVNDVCIEGKKVCGILCEAGLNPDNGRLDYAVAGIGINVGFREFPEELRGIADSVSNVCGKKISRSRLTAELMNELNALYPQLESGGFMAEYRARSNVIGRDVIVLRGNERRQAKALDIDDDGSLIVETPDGRREILHSGEISVRFG